MRYILHYTEPGDLVFDGFCGTGMTGVAAQMCGDKAVVESLGYKVDKVGTISQQETDEYGKAIWKQFSKIGARRVVLNDLSPAATFIAHNYLTPFDAHEFEREAKRILKEVEAECGWMYETKHKNGAKGKISSVIWSDVFVCPECATDIVFWENAVDIENGNVLDDFSCPKCTAAVSKRNLDHSWVTQFDPLIGQTISQARQVPVRINYRVNGKKYDKQAEENDLELIKKVDSIGADNLLLPIQIPDGDKTGEPIRIGLTHVHHLYTTRNYNALATFRKLSRSSRYLSRIMINGPFRRGWDHDISPPGITLIHPPPGGQR